MESSTTFGHKNVLINGLQYNLKYILLFGGLAFFWAIENFILQASVFSIHPVTKYPYFYQGIRFFLNFLAAAIVLLLFNRFWLIFIIIIDFLLSLLILAYNQYFHSVLSIYFAFTTVKEGLRVVGFALQFIPSFVWGLLVCALIIKIIWIFNITPQPSKFRWRGIALSVCLFILIILAIQFTSFKFINNNYSIKRMVYAYGYTISLINDILQVPEMSEITKEVNQHQAISPDRLWKKESLWPVGEKIVVIQLESFDYNILNYEIHGSEVSPYLNQLARNSRLFKIVSYHSISTADMDFAVLSGGLPSSRMVSYKIPGISYNNSLPRFLSQNGFYTVSFHGNTGDFFNRKVNFQRMGFDEVFFREDLKNMRLAHSYWGVRDAEIFRLSCQKILASDKPEFHFIITLDSHAPFDLITDQEKEIFPKSKRWQENYFNSMRVLDRNVKNYIESLPSGTMVILYGDHTSKVNYGNFQAARYGETDYVPCIVHIHKSSVPWPPSQNHPPDLIEDLQILDIINHFRRSIIYRKKMFNY